MVDIPMTKKTYPICHLFKTRASLRPMRERSSLCAMNTSPTCSCTLGGPRFANFWLIQIDRWLKGWDKKNTKLGGASFFFRNLRSFLKVSGVMGFASVLSVTF